MTRVVLLLASLALSACAGSRVAPLPYVSTTTPVAGSGQVAVGAVTDTRGRADPNSYGVVRGLYGNTIRGFSTDGPVTATVAKALSDALAARGMLSRTGGGNEVRVTVSQFDATSYFRLEAKVMLLAQVVNAAGRTIYETKGQSMKVRGTGNQIGGVLFSDMDALSTLMPAAMSEAIDQIVDDAGFRRAVAGAGRPGV